MRMACETTPTHRFRFSLIRAGLNKLNMQIAWAGLLKADFLIFGRLFGPLRFSFFVAYSVFIFAYSGQTVAYSGHLFAYSGQDSLIRALQNSTFAYLTQPLVIPTPYCDSPG